MDDIEFIADFIRDIVDGTKPAGIRTLVYRDGGAEISPGNVVPLSVPEIYKPHKRVVKFEKGIKGTTKFSGTLTIDGIPHSVSGEGLTFETNPIDNTETTFTELRELPDTKVLEDGDIILVSKHNGVTKYSLLGRMDPNA